MKKEEAVNIVFEYIYGGSNYGASALEISLNVVNALTAAGLLPPCNKGGNYDWDDSEPVRTADTQ